MVKLPHEEKPSVTISASAGSKTVWPIQYLRGIAALMVVWHHSVEQFFELPGFFPKIKGAAGVDLFFVISGFIMVVATMRSNVTAKQFLIRRFIRVAPMYWLLTAMMVVIWLVQPNLFKTLNVSFGTFVASIVFLPHFSRAFPEQIWPLLVPGWTLNFEIFFYVVFAASMLCGKTARTLAAIFVLSFLVAIGQIFKMYSPALYVVYTSPLLLEFVFGMLIAHLWTRAPLWLSLKFSVLSMALGFYLLFAAGDNFQNPYTRILAPIFGAGLIVIGALNKRLQSWRSEAWRAMGDISYSLYLTHIFALGGVRFFWAKIHPTPFDISSAFTFMLLCILASMFIGWLTYRFVEVPMTLKLIGLESSLSGNHS